MANVLWAGGKLRGTQGAELETQLNPLTRGEGGAAEGAARHPTCTLTQAEVAHDGGCPCVCVFWGAGGGVCVWGGGDEVRKHHEGPRRRYTHHRSLGAARLAPPGGVNDCWVPKLPDPRHLCRPLLIKRVPSTTPPQLPYY